MKFGKALRSATVAAGLVLGGAAAQASPLYFFGNLPAAGGAFPTDPSSAPRAKQAEFVAAVAITNTETFESSPAVLLAGSLNGFSNSMSVFGDGSTLSQAAPDPLGLLVGAEVRSGTNFSGRFNTTNGASSGRWIESDSAFTIRLESEVGAIGFFGTDFGDFDGALNIALYRTVNGVDQLVEDNAFTDSAGAPLQPRNTTAAQDGSLLFFGFASDQLFNKVVFTINQGSGPLDYLGFDDIMVGNLRNPTGGTVPEPGSLALAGLALFAAGWARKSQRSA